MPCHALPADASPWSILGAMPKRPSKSSEPPKPIIWSVYKFASKAVWLGAVEAPDEATAMERGAAEFGGGRQAADGDTQMTPPPQPVWLLTLQAATFVLRSRLEPPPAG
jgi:hypothetical protein